MDSVLCDQSGDKGWRNTFEIAAMFSHRDVAAQEALIDTLEGSQESTNICPHAFAGVDMNFSNAISVVIACPFMHTRIDSRMRSKNMVVTEPLVRATMGLS